MKQRMLAMGSSGGSGVKFASGSIPANTASFNIQTASGEAFSPDIVIVSYDRNAADYHFIWHNEVGGKFVYGFNACSSKTTIASPTLSVSGSTVTFSSTPDVPSKFVAFKVSYET